jgi:hypothetical protein
MQSNKPGEEMMRKIVLLILMVGLALSCSQKNKLVSISGDSMDKPAVTDYLSWKTGLSGAICAGANYSTASGFIHNFSAYSESMPLPIVAWAADGKRKGKAPFMDTEDAPCLDFPDRESWAEALRKIGTWAGPYQTNTYPGFVEIVWANKVDEAGIRKSLEKWVPPILFRSRYAADYLKMWHTISGMEFKYDPAVVTKALEYERNRLLEESDPDLPVIAESPHQPFPLGFVNFTTSEKLAITDFMPRLAAHVGGLARGTHNGWIIEQFQRNEQGLALIRSCLDHLKKHASDLGNPEEMEILSRIGIPALPELIREFKEMEIDKEVYGGDERKLITVLSRISSPERDAAFVAALKDSVAGKRRSGLMNLDLIIKGVTQSNCQAAIPILEQIAAKKQDIRRTQTAAKIALYALGRPAPDDTNFRILVGPKAQNAANTDTGVKAMELLRAVLVQSDQYETGMKLRSIEKTDSGIALIGQYAQSSKKIGPHSSWVFTIPLLRPDRALVSFEFYCGELCGQGYRGKLRKNNGRWIMTNWEGTWVS